MKLSKHVGIIALFAVMGTANADIAFQVAPGQCDNIAGTWAGTGKVKAMSGMVKCDYSGDGVITGSTNFSVAMNLQKTGGAPICPSSEYQELTGTCDNATGAVRISSKEVNLSGSFTDNNANLAGTISIEGIKGDLTVTLNR